jgi:hypothetical protein
MVPKPTKDTKMVMWDPGRGFDNPDQYFEFHGMKFYNKCVQPVTDDVFEAVKHIHNFHIVYARKNLVLSFENPVGELRKEVPLFETENTLVQ